MNIFQNLRVYADKWNLTDSRDFSDEEKAMISSAVVVASQFGNSVCFFLNGGGQTFIPLSTDSTVGVGESVDLNKAKLLTLSRKGDADIQRVQA